VIRCVDLFCGLGGLTHGLIQGGIRVEAGIDIDEQCRFPFEQNNRAEFVSSDIRDITGDDIIRLWKGGGRTLLAGCAPCQPFSTYSRTGRKAETVRSDKAWKLVEDFGRLISEASPSFVTMENVPQLLDHRVFTKFLSSLANYHVWYQVVECANIGIPQKRKRLVLLASRLGPISLFSPRINETATVRGAIGHLPRLEAGESDPGDALHSACRLSELNLRRIRASRAGGTWREWNTDLLAACHAKASGSTYPSIYGRMEWDSPSPTITTQCFGYGNGRFGHPDQDRAITLREAALLQTFPSSYRFVRDGDTVRFSVLGRLIGNAVPVRLGEIVAESLVRHLRSITRSARKERPQT